MIGVSNLVNAAAQVTAERMLDALLIGAVLAVFAWVLLRALPRPNSSTRFAVWFTALLATVFLPLFHGPQQAFGHVGPTVQPLISVPGSWALYLFVGWAVLTGIALVRVGLGFLELRRLRRSCRAIESADQSWQVTVARTCPRRRVELLTSDRIHVPTALGFIRPAIVIPAGLSLSSAEINQVLLHELAHLRRWDDWTNVFQKCVKALLFFHPAVWWMESRISLEREMACDDAVLAETGSPRAYAECLATLAEKSLLQRSAALAQAAVNRIRQTTLRVARILDVNRPQAAPARKSALALVGLFACACCSLMTQVPRFISFEDEPLTLAAAAPPVPGMQALSSAAIVPRPVALKIKPAAHRTAHARSPVTGSNPRLAGRGSEVAQQRAREPRVIPASTKVAPRPAVTTGVLVIMVDDPDFGPMPVVYRFAIWQVPPSQATEQEAPPSKT